MSFLSWCPFSGGFYWKPTRPSRHFRGSNPKKDKAGRLVIVFAQALAPEIGEFQMPSEHIKIISRCLLFRCPAASHNASSGICKSESDGGVSSAIEALIHFPSVFPRLLMTCHVLPPAFLTASLPRLCTISPVCFPLNSGPTWKLNMWFAASSVSSLDTSLRLIPIAQPGCVLCRWVLPFGGCRIEHVLLCSAITLWRAQRFLHTSVNLTHTHVHSPVIVGKVTHTASLWAGDMT